MWHYLFFSHIYLHPQRSNKKNPEGQKSVLLTLMPKEWWILFDLVICAVPVFIVGASDAGLRHSKELNQPQIALVKSIASPEFQGLMQDSIKVNGLCC